ncbi:MAG: hypothetical protein NVS3B3_03630 [Aquirhabdus sp.]
MNKDNHVTKLANQQETNDLILKLSNDGFVRMDFKDLMKTSLSHLISINEETKLSGSITDIFGYTEWVSMTVPVISVGWDWKLSHDDRFVKIVRIGQPRSNVMLLDYMQCDIGLDNTESLMNQKIDTIAWEVIVKEYIIKIDNRDDMVLSYS